MALAKAVFHTDRTITFLRSKYIVMFLKYILHMGGFRSEAEKRAATTLSVTFSLKDFLVKEIVSI